MASKWWKTAKCYLRNSVLPVHGSHHSDVFSNYVQYIQSSEFTGNVIVNVHFQGQYIHFYKQFAVCHNEVSPCEVFGPKVTTALHCCTSRTPMWWKPGLQSDHAFALGFKDNKDMVTEWREIPPAFVGSTWKDLCRRAWLQLSNSDFFHDACRNMSRHFIGRKHVMYSHNMDNKQIMEDPNNYSTDEIILKWPPMVAVF